LNATFVYVLVNDLIAIKNIKVNAVKKLTHCHRPIAARCSNKTYVIEKKYFKSISTAIFDCGIYTKNSRWNLFL